MPLLQVMPFITILGGNMEMRLYYIAYQYQSGLEMFDGPFGTASEAYNVREEMVAAGGDDENLKIVVEYKEMVVL